MSFTTPRPFLDAFAETERGRLLLSSRTLRLASGETLFRRGDSGGDLYVVTEGEMFILDTRSVPETVLSRVRVGGAVGEMTILDSGPRGADVRANGPAVCAHWPKATLVALLDSDPGLAASFYRAVAQTVIQHARSVTASAMAGAFASSPPPASLLPAESESARLIDAATVGLAAARDAGSESERIESITAMLAAAERWFAGQSDAAVALRVGTALRAAVGVALSEAATCRAFIERPEAQLLPASVMSHLVGGKPNGTTPVGTALDAAMLKRPTIRGLRWRGKALRQALKAAIPESRRGRLVLVNAASLLPDIIALDAVNPLQVVLVESSQDGATAAKEELRTRAPRLEAEVLVEDFSRIGAGRSVSFWTQQDAVVLDGLADLLPGPLLVGAVSWGLMQLNPTGVVLSTHLAPTDDAAMFAELFRLPLIRRRPPTLTSLLQLGGRAVPRLVLPPDLDGAGILAITQRGSLRK